VYWLSKLLHHLCVSYPHVLYDALAMFNIIVASMIQSLSIEVHWRFAKQFPKNGNERNICNVNSVFLTEHKYCL
jgi:hypothetical protein